MGKSIKLLSAAVAIALLSSNASYATNGMFLIGQSTKSRAMGGTAFAMSDDTIMSATNPATLFDIKGRRFDVGADLFNPLASAALGEGSSRYKVNSEFDEFGVKNWMMMPNIGVSMKMSNMAMGLTMVSVGGGGSKYNFNVYNAQQVGKDTTKTLGVSLMVAQMNPTLAMKLNKQHTVGASLIIGMQRFKAYGLEEFQRFTPSGTADRMTNQGSDYSIGVGLRLGWLGKFMNNKLRVGVAGATQTYMRRFTKYSELFAEGGSINTPGNIGAGIAYQYNDKFKVAFDINYIMYEDVASISNKGPNTGGELFPVSKAVNGLGEKQGLGFGWKNQTVYKLGMAFDYTDNLTLRAGWNYGKSPINEQREIIFNIVAPATVQHHMTLGATYATSKNSEWSFSYVHAFKYCQDGPTYIGSTGEICMSQNSYGLSYGMGF
ncbi:MAG TPA: hypothetical protein ENI98_09270 [Gammaproteobacteria bacterium]|nr:hypothetical protein [Gammaproteobacteria bacterium]